MKRTALTIAMFIMVLLGYAQSWNFKTVGNVDIENTSSEPMLNDYSTTANA